MDRTDICIKHNLNLQYINIPFSITEAQGLCNFCIVGMKQNQYMSIKEISKYFQTKKAQLIDDDDQLFMATNSILNFLKQIIDQPSFTDLELQKLYIQELNENIENIVTYNKDYKAMCVYENLNENNFDYFVNKWKYFTIYIQLFKRVEHQILNILEVPIVKEKYQEVASLLEKFEKYIYRAELQKFILIIEKQDHIDKEQQSKENPQWQLAHQVKSGWCYFLTFNRDCTTLAAGFRYGKIILYNFNKGLINEQQQLYDHQKSIISLSFNQNRLVSIGEDKCLKVWEKQNEKWFCAYSESYQNAQIQCVLLLGQENRILFNVGCTVMYKIWKQSYDFKWSWETKQQLKNSKENILCQALSGDEKFLYVSHQDSSLFIYHYKEYDKWLQVNKVEHCYPIEKMCFLSQNVIAFYKGSNKFIEIFENSSNNLIKIKRLDMKAYDKQDSGFPLYYSTEKSIFLCRNWKNVITININTKQNKFDQSILDFQTEYVYGCLSDSGQYLVTWDSISWQIQVRELKI